MDNILLSSTAFLCILSAYIYRHYTTISFNNSLIFWFITAVLFGTFTLTTLWTTGHHWLEKTMYVLIWCCHISVLIRMRIENGSLYKQFIRETHDLRSEIPTVVYYFLYIVLTLGVILFLTFSLLKLFMFSDSLLLASTINRLGILLDGLIFSLLLRYIITTRDHEEKYIFWSLCFVSASILIYVQNSIHGMNYFNIPAIEPTISSAIYSSLVLICMLIRKYI